ncbi:MAG: AMP-binding protein [Verrucomicrobiota bacterium]
MTSPVETLDARKTFFSPTSGSNKITLQELFERAAAVNSDQVAVCFPEQFSASAPSQITYRELNARANQLARHLRKAGVGPDVVVGIYCERSLELIISVLAVIKAGGAYVPLDPNYPKERLSFMLEDTRSPIILTQEKLATTLPKLEARLICLDTDWKTVAKESTENLELLTNADDLAYLIYTSGSTGKPKGVAMRQGPLVNLLHWQFKNWSAQPNAKTLQFASLNFDVSFQEIFATLASGGTLVLVSEQLRRDSPQLLQFLDEQEVERLFLPFVALKHLAAASEHRAIFPRKLREIITAGEQLQITPAVVNFFSKLNNCALHNQYGPSETHVVTAYELKGHPRDWPPLPSIGKAIDNTQIFLLDDKLQPVPRGQEGELYIGGECLASSGRTYLPPPRLA